MRALLLIAGALATALGFVAHARLGDPQLLQGALTLGGGWIICAVFFSFGMRWHGIGGAGVLGLLAAARCAPALLKLASAPEAPFQAAALLLATVVLVASVRALLAERARRQIEQLRQESE